VYQLYYQATFLNKVDGRHISHEFVWVNALRGLASLIFFSLREYYRREKYGGSKKIEDNFPAVHEHSGMVCQTLIEYPHGVRTTINELLKSLESCQNFLFELYGRNGCWQGNTFFFQWKGNYSKSPHECIKSAMWLAPFVEKSSSLNKLFYPR